MTRPTVLVVHPGAELFGSDRMLYESVAGLRDTGARVVVALPALGPLVEPLRRTGAEVVVIPMLVLRKALLRPSGWPQFLRDTLRGVGAAWRLISKVRPTAVYVSTITIPEWPLLARLRGVPAITHVHEAEASAQRLVNLALYLPQLPSNRLLVNSQFSLDTVRGTVPSLAARGEVVYNGVAGPPETAPEAPRAELGDEIAILYVGRLSPRKGPDVVIDAARVLEAQGARTRVTLLGDVFPGYEWYRKELEEKATEARLSNPVEFPGFQPDIWPYLAATDVLVVPSRLDEPFGNTAVEGILARRPVVVSDTSGLREAAGGYPTALLVPPGDPQALAAALGRIRAEWGEIRTAVDGALAQAQARHAPERYREAVVARVLGSVSDPSGARPKRGNSAPRID